MTCDGACVTCDADNDTVLWSAASQHHLQQQYLTAMALEYAK
jgi:hypothetical protein